MKILLAILATLTLAGCNLTGDPPNSYYYCWDDGHGQPHHFGHPVTGDHVCSDDELDSGPPPLP